MSASLYRLLSYLSYLHVCIIGSTLIFSCFVLGRFRAGASFGGGGAAFIRRCSAAFVSARPYLLWTSFTPSCASTWGTEIVLVQQIELHCYKWSLRSLCPLEPWLVSVRRFQLFLLLAFLSCHGHPCLHSHPNVHSTWFQSKCSRPAINQGLML